MTFDTGSGQVKSCREGRGLAHMQDKNEEWTLQQTFPKHDLRNHLCHEVLPKLQSCKPPKNLQNLENSQGILPRLNKKRFWYISNLHYAEKIKSRIFLFDWFSLGHAPCNPSLSHQGASPTVLGSRVRGLIIYIYISILIVILISYASVY